MSISTRAGDVIIRHADDSPTPWVIGVVEKNGDLHTDHTHVTAGRIEAMKIATALAARVGGRVYLIKDGVWSEIQML